MHKLPKDDYIFAVGFPKMTSFWKPKSENHNNKQKKNKTVLLPDLNDLNNNPIYASTTTKDLIAFNWATSIDVEFSFQCGLISW